jgi:hypothetical protein
MYLLDPTGLKEELGDLGVRGPEVRELGFMYLYESQV